MFYKIMQGNTVIDAIAGVQYVVFQERNRLNIIGKKAEAFGIMSSDMSTIWHVEGLAEIPAGAEYQTVIMVEIDEEEYDALRKQLEAGDVVEDPEEEQPPEEGETEEPEVVMSPTEMRIRINELTATVEALTAEKDMLMECVLEMSAVVYA